ncbi:MAG: Fic family protein [Clostridia bacterium]
MDTKLIAKIISDKNGLNLKKMQYKYSVEAVTELLVLFKNAMYKSIPILDFSGEKLVYLENITQVKMNAFKLLFSVQGRSEQYGTKAMEEEIYATFCIENIESTRESIQHIVKGYAPTNESEKRIYSMKKGLDYIGNKDNKITEENIYKLYQLTVGDLLAEKEKLLPNKFYRHDSVYVLGGKVEHEGLFYQKLPKYMQELVAFINFESEFNDLWKAAIIHFYIAYLHPYFDGNGRMARLIHLWYLLQQGYSATLFIPFSSSIYQSRKHYYDAYSLIEENAKISGVIDVTPFLLYFIENVYNKLNINDIETGVSLELFQSYLDAGSITEKEKDLWNFVLAAYGVSEFSTKQLEKDFGNAAYATIRSFVLKFRKMGLLSGQNYANKVKYRVRSF